jgi:GTP1/Obg family GTP-binding protein
MKKLLKKLFNIKSKHDLDGDGKLESYRQEMEGVFSEFKTKVETLEKVEAKYVELVKEEKQKKESEVLRFERNQRLASVRKNLSIIF